MGRDIDFIEDDMDRLVKAKKEITDALAVLEKEVHNFDAVHIEQQIDDMLYNRWIELCVELGSVEDFPKSDLYKQWLAKRR